MPDHCHVLLTVLPNHELPKLVHSIKSYSANQVNSLRNSSGALWQEGYRDDVPHNYDAVLGLMRYVEDNPVNAGLVRTPDEYLWSSAHDTYHVRCDPV